MNVKIRKGDTVELISGKRDDIGKRGEVINVLIDKRRVVVQGINIRTKHQKQQQNQSGRNIQSAGRIQFEAPIDISNIMLVCPKCNEATRVGIQRDEQGAHRICKQCEATIG
ncbi:MAG: 50S ribosomal protein L24 [Anaerolineales bacterium]|nr:50S ribosomal protein L24 [Anaerolineales bacterium]